MTGSDTSSNALFATLQQTAAQGAGLDPTLMVAANTSRGVVGKDDQPAESDYRGHGRRLLGRESDILCKVILWSLGLLAVLCLLVGLQSSPSCRGCCHDRAGRPESRAVRPPASTT